MYLAEHALAFEEVPGAGFDGVPVRVGCGSLTELTKLPGRYATLVPVPVPAPVFYFSSKGIYPYTPVTGVTQNLHKLRVRA